MWPGFGENMRVLDWIIARCRGEADASRSPIGLLPRVGDLNLEGIAVSAETMQSLLEVDREAWQAELVAIGEYLNSFGSRTPRALQQECQRVATALQQD